MAPAGSVSCVADSWPLLALTLTASGSRSQPRACSVISTERPPAAQPGPSSYSVALAIPAACCIGPATAGTSVRCWYQPGTWWIG